MTIPPALAIRSLTKTYRTGFARRSEHVLRGIDLELEAGGTLGLVGPNGSGKTTLLRIAAGVERPSSGEALLFGMTSSAPRARRQLGFLPEGSPFPVEVRAGALMEFLAALRGIERGARRARTRAALAAVGLEDARDKRLAHFSKGMLRRFGLAQAFLVPSGIVLLDEPTAGLDARGLKAFAQLMHTAREQGLAVVLCSHGFGDILEHCDEMAVLIEGQLRARGRPAEMGSGERLGLEIEGLTPERWPELERWLEQAGAHVLFRGPGSNLLIELYDRWSEPTR